MRRTLQIINSLKRNNLIQDYAIGGGMATALYTEPFLTYDLDIFIILPHESKLVILSPIYNYLVGKGAVWQGEHIIVNKIPVQFIAADELEKEAIENARNITIRGVKTKVISPEYLIALQTRTKRAKDLQKRRMLLEQTSIDKNKLKAILRKFKIQ